MANDATQPAPRWIKAQTEVGPVDSVWWALVDTRHEGIRVKVLGLALAQEVLDALNYAETIGGLASEKDETISS